MKLQRGRRSSRRIGRSLRASPTKTPKASTRPPFITADRILDPIKVWLAPELQRGRRSSRRIGRCLLFPPTGLRRFNEAAVHHGGSAVRRLPKLPKRLASTRPPFITADRFNILKTAHVGIEASTRPPFITADRVGGRMRVRDVVDVLQRGRRSSRRIGRVRASCRGASVGFNEAAVHHGGSAGQAGRRDSSGCASTRPPFITADRAMPTTAAQWVIWLQRGRRSSRRIGPQAR